MKKLIDILLSIITLGFSTYAMYRKNEKKIESLYLGTNLILEKTAQVHRLVKEGKIKLSEIPKHINPDDFKKTLRAIQERYKVAKEVKTDLDKLIKDSTIVRVFNGA